MATENVNRLALPGGVKEKYQPLERELFWDVPSKTLFIYWNKKWWRIGGHLKDIKLKAGDNIELKEDQTPNEIRLVDDVDTNTTELGKFSKTKRWKGTVHLGKVENKLFFPLIKASKDIERGGGYGGKVYIKAIWGTGQEIGAEYTLTLTSFGTAKIKGGSESAVKAFIARGVIQGTTYLGLYIVDLNGLEPASIDVWFNGWKHIPEKLKPILEYEKKDFTSFSVVERC